MGTSILTKCQTRCGIPICVTTHLDFRTKTTIRKYVMSFLHYFPNPICLKDSRFLSIVPRWTIWWTFSLVPKICTPRKIFLSGFSPEMRTVIPTKYGRASKSSSNGGPSAPFFAQHTDLHSFLQLPKLKRSCAMWFWKLVGDERNFQFVSFESNCNAFHVRKPLIQLRYFKP